MFLSAQVAHLVCRAGAGTGLCAAEPCRYSLAALMTLKASAAVEPAPPAIPAVTLNESLMHCTVVHLGTLCH